MRKFVSQDDHKTDDQRPLKRPAERAFETKSSEFVDRRPQADDHRSLQHAADHRPNARPRLPVPGKPMSETATQLHAKTLEELPTPSAERAVVQRGEKAKVAAGSAGGAVGGAVVGAAAEIAGMAAAGAAVGSVVPIIGTAIGVVIGAGLGGYLIHRSLNKQPKYDDEKRLPLSKEERTNHDFKMLPMLAAHKERHKEEMARPLEGNEPAAVATVYEIQNGNVVRAGTDETLTTGRDLTVIDAVQILLLEGRISEAVMSDPELAIAQAQQIGGIYIWVMDGNGRIFAAPERYGVLHHSRFLQGRAIVAGGSIRVNNGTINLIDNKSGHYHPGPAHLWQALRHMQSNDVDLQNVQIEVRGVNRPIPNAQAFVTAFDPFANPQYFKINVALKFLNNHFDTGGA